MSPLQGFMITFQASLTHHAKACARPCPTGANAASHGREPVGVDEQ
jgi:hypothetical protein